MKSRSSESLPVDVGQIKWLHQLIREGEGWNLEFKLRAAFPEKLVHEIIAFANTRGGTLLVGVDDDGRMAGVKYPEEESLLVMQSLIKHCRPRIRVHYFYVRLTAKKWVVVFEVPESKRKPIRFLEGKNNFVHYIRYEDKSIKASREAEGIVRLQSTKTDVGFTYGDNEAKIIKALAAKSPLTLAEISHTTGLDNKQLSQRIIQLAGAHAIGWRPVESGDIFFSLSV
jgi:predicted HTH transcriptional regulator